MRHELAAVVYPVLAHGLRLRERLRRGEGPDPAAEQERLTGLLGPDAGAARLPEYGGDGQRFLGARYALACWLDELFVADPSWGPRWAERPLEVALFETNDRARNFWSQAGLARDRPDTDALEAFYLCVMLGFRGEGPGGEGLPAWREAVEARLAAAQPPDWPEKPEEFKPQGAAAPWRGRERLRRVTALLLAVAALLVPAVAVFLADRFGAP
jgi:type VI secretion system protein ImpK